MNELSATQLDTIIEEALNEVLPNATIIEPIRVEAEAYEYSVESCIDAIKYRYHEIMEKIEEIIASEEMCYLQNERHGLNTTYMRKIESEIYIFGQDVTDFVANPNSENGLSLTDEAIIMHNNLKNKCIQALELIEKNCAIIEERARRQQNDLRNILPKNSAVNRQNEPKIILFQSGDKNFDTRNRNFINTPIIATKSGNHLFDEENQSFADDFISANMQNR